ncbi:trifunctional transcriptional regulator/proline dehydrogenase/L-glutamate gamma-semialdehyde dehydrogenase [Pandoraea capi]|uniref:Trifunctional transcriptional regulator/proline dehydrogenase/L-glutamate gamma-semialdehyde dehydrogenase n=1 Tax=Pandoraea capi TaxID=2508286 RepID=A0ABY6WDF1_9BURK|nr:trifunctional transcriptional regulator/proline dehydrogenase/L-glutamate gamma-semialdehyde dehydrogenase [Pandoraea capi]
MREWAIGQSDPRTAARTDEYLPYAVAGATATLRGPTGERNVYTLSPRGNVLCVAATASGARAQFAAVLATGNHAIFEGASGEHLVASLPESLAAHATLRVSPSSEASEADDIQAVLFEGDGDELLSFVSNLAKRKGPIIPVQGIRSHALESGAEDYVLERLLVERSISVNLTAAGGEAQRTTI